MPVDPKLMGTIQKELQKAQRILVVSHIRPDGDAVGALLGIGLALQTIGKQAQMVLTDGVPPNFFHLKGSEQVKSEAKGKFDYIVVVDCSDMPRIGEVLNGYARPDLNIDHHITNSHFARHNMVEGERAATCEILAQYMGDLGLPITPDVANALLTGIITDTIGFRIATITPQSLRLTAQLMEAGGKLSDMYYPALVSHPFSAVRYWGAGLSKLQKDGRLVWTSLSLAEREEAGYSGKDDADLVNVLSAIEDTDIAVIFIQQSVGHVKISWRLCGRSSGNHDVSKIAQRFGGGGHKAAAGAELDGSMEEIQRIVLMATQAELK